MKVVSILFLLSISFIGYGQKVYSEKPDVCPLKFILEDKIKYIDYETGDSVLALDFFAGVEEKYMTKLHGVFMFQVMIDTANNVCCVSYTNKSNLSPRKIDVPSQIKNMPGWKREAPGQENENICALINIYVDNYEYKIQHIGYNRNRGKQLLRSSIYKRRSDSLPVTHKN